MQLWKTLPLLTAALVLQAQVLPVPTPPTAPLTAPPLYRVSVVQGTATTLDYRNLQTSTKIDLEGTVLLPKAEGVAKIKNKAGRIQITAKVKHLPPATTLGKAYLTYVLWGISPEGRAANLGELVLKHGKGKLEVFEPLPAFGLVVTAEPYFAVTQPSDAVAMVNKVRPGSLTQIQIVEARYELLKRDPSTLTLAETAPLPPDGRTPFEVLQARNAVRIAKAAGAELYAPDAFAKAKALLQEAEADKGSGKAQVLAKVLTSREATQKAEDARLIAVQRQAEEQVALERQMAAEKLAMARKQADLAASAEAEAHLQARKDQSENKALKSQLMAQLATVLETRATARGLIVSMSGVVFKTGQATLLPATREKLAKIAGILAAHKGLSIEANGYTDNTGSPGDNRQLSEKRAKVTKDFLVRMGVPSETIVFRGYGDENPIASNETDLGRQRNRRVELLVVGEGATPEDPETSR